MTHHDHAGRAARFRDLNLAGRLLLDNGQRSGVTPLHAIKDQAARIRAARAAAERRRIPLVINARTDSFLLSLGADLEERIAMTIERGRAYLEAGADLVFVPVLNDPDLVRRVAGAINGPLSLMRCPAPRLPMCFLTQAQAA